MTAWSVLMSVSFVFFFKQKTAYEMRISDWSSDVCSSDLVFGLDRMIFPGRRGGEAVAGRRRGINQSADPGCPGGLEDLNGALHVGRHIVRRPLDRRHDVADAGEMQDDDGLAEQAVRSEEHTSELQSLMRRSFSVLLLQTKKPPNDHN